MFSIHFYRIYETSREIDLTRLERELPGDRLASRSGLSRIAPKSIHIDNTPLSIPLDNVHIQNDSIACSFQVQARIFDIGAISICLSYEEPVPGACNLKPMALTFAGQRSLDEAFTGQLKRLQELFQDSADFYSVDPSFYEDYTIYRIDDSALITDPVPLLMGEDINFSLQIREQVLGNRLSYGSDDFVILTWDTALICDADDPSDLRDLIEFANVQLLEFRYYDQLLNRQMEIMYDDIEKAGQRSTFTRLRRFRKILSALMGFIADITEVTEKVDNLIKITEDIYYARVYQTTLRVLRIDQWREGVARKLQVIQQNYSMLSSELNVQHSNVLEWIIILLIALEFAFALWEALK
ncbi:MAG: hypothetical protein ABRQ26_15890 [Syntrophomonadaceae bacterium]